MPYFIETWQAPHTTHSLYESYFAVLAYCDAQNVQDVRIAKAFCGCALLKGRKSFIL
jgi:hypothetical protein